MATSEPKRDRTFEQRRCPVCGSDQSQILFRQSFEQLSNVKLLDGYDVVVCLNCGAGYADDLPPQAVFDRYYQELSKYDYEFRGGKDSFASKTRFDDAVDTIQRFIPLSTARILEIGCGSGHLLKVLQQRGFSNVQGVDPSPSCVRVASTLGVAVETATVFTIEPPQTQYDFIILMGVLEHIRDLDRTIAQFYRLLRKGGRVYLEVPDGSRLDPGLDAPFQEFSVEHINFFSARSLTNLMHQRGFNGIATGNASRPQNETICLSVFGVYEKGDAPGSIEYDFETRPGLEAYIRGCREQDETTRERIEAGLASGEKMIVWGVGAHTLRLLRAGALDTRRISMFVDSNPKYQEQELRGLPVIAPRDLRGHSEPILISSKGFQREIEDQIRNSLRLDNRLILLY